MAQTFFDQQLCLARTFVYHNFFGPLIFGTKYFRTNTVKTRLSSIKSQPKKVVVVVAVVVVVVVVVVFVVIIIVGQKTLKL